MCRVLLFFTTVLLRRKFPHLSSVYKSKKSNLVPMYEQTRYNAWAVEKGGGLHKNTEPLHQQYAEYVVHTLHPSLIFQGKW